MGFWKYFQASVFVISAIVTSYVKASDKHTEDYVPMCFANVWCFFSVLFLYFFLEQPL